MSQDGKPNLGFGASQSPAPTGHKGLCRWGNTGLTLLYNLNPQIRTWKIADIRNC
jgi:hypothetical protein